MSKLKFDVAATVGKYTGKDGTEKSRGSNDLVSILDDK